jgi:predicted acylesterase/phospholipase RssA
VLNALERLGVQPDLIVGTSIGACVASQYASRFALQEIEMMMRRTGRYLRQPSLPIYSFKAGSGLEGIIRSAFSPEVRIEDLPLRCAFVAADLQTGEVVVHTHGSLLKSVRASASIPGIFPPTYLDGRLLIDGGVIHPVPCVVARSMGADVVIGVSLGVARAEESQAQTTGAPFEAQPPTSPSPRSDPRPPTWPAAMLRALDILQRSLGERCLHEADVPIHVLAPPRTLMDWEGGPEFVEAGERAVEAASDQLRACLPWLRK